MHSQATQFLSDKNAEVTLLKLSKNINYFYILLGTVN